MNQPVVAGFIPALERAKDWEKPNFHERANDREKPKKRERAMGNEKTNR